MTVRLKERAGVAYTVIGRDGLIEPSAIRRTRKEVIDLYGDDWLTLRRKWKWRIIRVVISPEDENA